MKKLLLLTFIPLLLISCGDNPSISNSESDSLSSSLNSSTDDSSSSSTSGTTSTNSSSTSSSSSSSSSSTSNEDSWFNNRTKLECGYYQMDLPKNSDNPINLKTTLSADNSTWLNNDWKDSIPEYNRYIYKNACDDGPTNHKTSPDFYSDDLGGLKLSRPGEGLQSPSFTHSGAKLEIRIGISSVNNNNKKPEEGKDPLHVYFFDKDGNYLNKYAFKEGSITAQSKDKELKFYYTENAINVSYFEIRMNTYPYKGSQCYNFGIKYVNIKSWERI